MLKEINLENLEERLIFTSVYQNWFKFLAFISFVCALIVYAALIWLLVCRSRRLRKTDEQIKREAKIRYKTGTLDFTDKLRYLFLGNLNVKSPDLVNYSSSTILNSKQVDETTTINNNNNISGAKLANQKSKYKRKDSKFKDLQALDLNKK